MAAIPTVRVERRPRRMTYQMSAHFDLALYLPSDFTLQLSAAELSRSGLSRSASPPPTPGHVRLYTDIWKMSKSHFSYHYVDLRISEEFWCHKKKKKCDSHETGSDFSTNSLECLNSLWWPEKYIIFFDKIGGNGRQMCPKTEDGAKYINCNKAWGAQS